MSIYLLASVHEIVSWIEVGKIPIGTYSLTKNCKEATQAALVTKIQHINSYIEWKEDINNNKIIVKESIPIIFGSVYCRVEFVAELAKCLEDGNVRRSTLGNTAWEETTRLSLLTVLDQTKLREDNPKKISEINTTGVEFESDDSDWEGYGLFD